MRYEGLANRIYQQERIPYEMQMVLKAQIQTESNWNPSAQSAFARGLTQFIPSTARAYGVMYGTSQAAVESQIRGQARYMKDLLRQYNGNITHAIMAYNWGGTSRYVAGKTGGRMPKETRDYVDRIARRVQYYR